MLTHFEKPESSRECYFKVSNSLQIICGEYQSSQSKFAGLYAIFKNDICYYVGQSQNLASRLVDHLTGKYKDCEEIKIFMATTNDFDDFYDRNKESRKSILDKNEQLLINKLKPLENLLNPDRNFNLDKSLRFAVLQDNVELCEYTDCRIYPHGNMLTITSGVGSCELVGKAYEDHNRFVISAHGAFGDDVFERGIL